MPRDDLAGKTWAEVMALLAGGQPGPGLRDQVAAKAGVAADDPAMDWAEWLGLFGDAPVSDDGTPLDCVAALMLEKMTYAEGERDMLLMQHQFRAEYPGGDSSMARTVSLPAAIAVRLVVEGEITTRGVHIPVKAEIYRPVLAELETLGIKLDET